MRFTQLTLEQYLNELASDKSVPGGGSVSAYGAALGMGLSQMVCQIALARKIKEGLSEQELKVVKETREVIAKTNEQLEKARRDAFRIVDADPEVYERVCAAYGKPELEETLHDSFKMQADLAFLIVMAFEWNAQLLDLIKGSIKNDLYVAASFLEGSFEGAYHTANINAKYMKDASAKEKAEKTLADLKARFEKGKMSV